MYCVFFSLVFYQVRDTLHVVFMNILLARKIATILRKLNTSALVKQFEETIGRVAKASHWPTNGVLISVFHKYLWSIFNDRLLANVESLSQQVS